MTQHDPHIPEPDPPRALQEDLRRLYTQPTPLEDQTDRQIMEAIRQTLPSRPALPTGHGRWRRLAAAAAVVAMLGTGWIWILQRPTPNPNSAAIASAGPEDLDHNGRVDILDAFAMARRFQSSQRSFLPDLNNDGLLDIRDIEALAQQAVALKGAEG